MRRVCLLEHMPLSNIGRRPSRCGFLADPGSRPPDLIVERGDELAPTGTPRRALGPDGLSSHQAV